MLVFGAGGLVAVLAAGVVGTELIAHGVLPGQQELDQLDGACAVASPSLRFSTPGASISNRFYSRNRRRTVGYTLAWPPGHRMGDPLPLIVMLHGEGGNHTDALAGMSPDQAVALRVGGSPLRPMALVTVDGGHGYWNPHPGDDPLAMIVDELIPLCRTMNLGRPPQQDRHDGHFDGWVRSAPRCREASRTHCCGGGNQSRRLDQLCPSVGSEPWCLRLCSRLRRRRRCDARSGAGRQARTHCFWSEMIRFTLALSRLVRPSPLVRSWRSRKVAIRLTSFSPKNHLRSSSLHSTSKAREESVHRGGEGVRVIDPREVPGPWQYRQLRIAQKVGQFADGCARWPDVVLTDHQQHRHRQRRQALRKRRGPASKPA